MTTLKRRSKALAALTAGGMFLFLASSLSAQVVRVNPAMKAEPNQNVRLGDLATVSGADARTAEDLLNLVIVPTVTQDTTVRAESILMAVITQVGPGKLADNLQVAGAATCEIKLAGTTPKILKAKTRPTPTAPVAADAPVITAVSNPAPVTIARTEAKPDAKNTAPTLAKLIIIRLQEDLNARPEDLRISFDTVNPQLDQSASAGRHWALRPVSRSLLGTVQIEAQLVEGSRILQKINLQVQVLKRENVFIATNTIAHGDVVTKSHFRSDEVWLDRKMPTYFKTEKDVIGLEAIRDVATGSTLDERDFRPVCMAARGEVVSVIFLHGNMKVQMKARAVEDGKLHDSIQVKNEATNELYDAVLIGKRLAVIGGTLDEAKEKQLREAR